MNDVTFRGRIMYPHVHQPHAFNEGDEPMYMVNIVIEQTDPIVQQISQMTQKLVNDELDGVQPTPDNLPLKVVSDNPNLAGCLVMRAKSKQKPGVVNQNMEPIIDLSCPADGDWCWFAVRLYSYNTRGNKGVSAAINNVMFESKGPAKLGTGGPPSPEESFKNVPRQQQPMQQGAVPNMFGPQQ